MSAVSRADGISSGSLVMVVVNSKGMVLEQSQGHLLAFQCSVVALVPLKIWRCDCESVILRRYS